MESENLEGATIQKEYTKCFNFVNGKDTISVRLKEVAAADYSLYTWAGAPVMAQFLLHHASYLKDKSVLELGCGTGLAGVVAAKCGARVILSDLPGCLTLPRDNCTLNAVTADVVPVTWGTVDERLLGLPRLDVIMASDCFYDEEDFEAVIFTVAFLIKESPGAEFWTTYQRRDTERTLAPLLEHWGLTARAVPLQAFGADSADIGGSGLPGNHTIDMFIVTAKPDSSK